MMPYIWKHPLGLEWPSLHTYGLMAVVALLMATWLIGRLSKRAGLDPDRMFNLSILLFLVGLLGARVLFVVVDWSRFRGAPAADVLKIWEGGLVWYGGVLFALPFGLWWMRRRKLPVWEATDILYIGTVFGLGFARWGCMAAGCCYGTPCSLPWAVQYTDPDSIALQELRHHDAAATATAHLHPTPIYASLMAFAIVGILLLILRRRRFAGQVTAVGLCLYALGRFLLEFLRGDRGRGIADLGDDLSLSTSQIIGIFVFILGLGTYLALAKRARARGSPAPGGPSR